MADTLSSMSKMSESDTATSPPAGSKTTRHSDVWYWQDGKVTNQHNGARQFMYLHFMNYVSARWMDERYGTRAPWSAFETPVKFDASLAGRGFRIDLDGFSLLEGWRDV